MSLKQMYCSKCTRAGFGLVTLSRTSFLPKSEWFKSIAYNNIFEVYEWLECECAEALGLLTYPWFFEKAVMVIVFQMLKFPEVLIVAPFARIHFINYVQLISPSHLGLKITLLFLPLLPVCVSADLYLVNTTSPTEIRSYSSFWYARKLKRYSNFYRVATCSFKLNNYRCLAQVWSWSTATLEEGVWSFHSTRTSHGIPPYSPS